MVILGLAFQTLNAFLENESKRVSQPCAERSRAAPKRGGTHVPVNMADSMANAGSWTVSGSRGDGSPEELQGFAKTCLTKYSAVLTA